MVMRHLCQGQWGYHPAGSDQGTPLSIRYARSAVVEFSWKLLPKSKTSEVRALTKGFELIKLLYLRQKTKRRKLESALTGKLLFRVTKSGKLRIMAPTEQHRFPD